MRAWGSGDVVNLSQCLLNIIKIVRPVCVLFRIIPGILLTSPCVYPLIFLVINSFVLRFLVDVYYFYSAFYLLL